LYAFVHHLCPDEFTVAGYRNEQSTSKLANQRIAIRALDLEAAFSVKITNVVSLLSNSSPLIALAYFNWTGFPSIR